MNTVQSFRSYSRHFKTLIIIVLLSVFSLSSVHAVAQAQAKPALEDVAKGLEKLPKQEASLFYMADYDEPSSLLEGPGDLFGYRAYLTGSYSDPVYFVNKENDRAGGIAAFKGNIYAEGFYRMNSAQYSVAELKQKQVWMRWDTTPAAYVIERGNPASLLLSGYVKNQKVTLLRGTGSAEIQAWMRAKEDPAAFEAAVHNRDLIFFSPSSKATKRFTAGGDYLEITIDASDLNQLYSGVEFDYVEAAFPPELMKKYLSTLVIKPSSTLK